MDPMIPVPYRIGQRWRDLDDTFTLALVPADGAEPPPFVPGQFNMLTAFGAGEVPISISGDPADTRSLVHTIRAVGAVTQVLRRLDVGAIVGVRGPFGSAWPLAAAVGRDLVMITGGLGLAPLRPAIYQALAQRDRFAKVCLYYGARGPDEMLYREQLRHWHRQAKLDINMTVDRAGRDWSGRVGVVTDLLRRPAFDPSNSVALICGPEVMMRFAVRALQRLGVPDAALFVSLERNMKCAVGSCGHCQLGPYFVCRDGPVFAYPVVADLMSIAEL